MALRELVPDQVRSPRMILLTLLLVLGFALIHLFIGHLRVLEAVPRSRWLSGAGGIAVAYIFLHVLPELSAQQRTFAEALGTGEEAAEGWVYLLALVGLAAFYGLERMARASRGATARAAGRIASRTRSSGSISAPSASTTS